MQLWQPKQSQWGFCCRALFAKDFTKGKPKTLSSYSRTSCGIIQRIARLVPNRPNMPKNTSIAYSSFKPAMPPVKALLDNIYLRRQTIIFYLSVKSQHTYITGTLLKLNNIHALICISNITTSVGVFQRATLIHSAWKLNGTLQPTCIQLHSKSLISLDCSVSSVLL